MRAGRVRAMKGCPRACSFQCENLTRLVCHSCGLKTRVCISHVESQAWSDHVQQCTPALPAHGASVCGNSSTLISRLESALNELRGWSTHVEFDGVDFGKAMFTDDAIHFDQFLCALFTIQALTNTAPHIWSAPFSFRRIPSLRSPRRSRFHNSSLLTRKIFQSPRRGCWDHTGIAQFPILSGLVLYHLRKFSDACRRIAILRTF